MKKSYIMKNAHSITRAAIQPGDNYAVTLAAALRIAWSDYKTSARAEWEAMTETEQINAIKAMTYYEYKNRDNRFDHRTKKTLPNVFNWVTNPADDLSAVINEAWIRLQAYLDDPRRAGLSLSRLLSRAVIISAQAIDRAERRNPSALRDIVRDDDGNITEATIDTTSPTAEPIAPGPEAAAIIADAIQRSAYDDTDRAIIKLIGKGYSNREIAVILNTSHTTINNRAAIIRARYNAIDNDGQPQKKRRHA